MPYFIQWANTWLGRVPIWLKEKNTQIIKDGICLQCGRPGFDPWVRRSPGEGNDNPLQYSCLESSMDRGYSSWGCKESDMTEELTLSHFQNNISPMTLVPQFENRLNQLFFFEQIKQRWKQHNTIQSHLLVRIFSYLLYSTSQHGDFPGGPVVKNPPCNAADVSSTPCGGIKIINTTSHKAVHHN